MPGSQPRSAIRRWLARLFPEAAEQAHVGDCEVHLGGWEVRLDGSEKCWRFLETHAVDEATAVALSHVASALTLTFVGGRLRYCDDIIEGEATERALSRDESALCYRPLPIHDAAVLEADPDGPHRLGGVPPPKLVLPVGEFDSAFQYLGYVSRDDDLLDWLPFRRLHLTFPLLLGTIGRVFLDYSDPLRPALVAAEALDEPHVPTAGTDRTTLLRYAAVRASSTPIEQALARGLDLETGADEHLGHVGVPIWIQYPEIPTCPRSGLTMRFVCQLTSSKLVAVESVSGARPTEDDRLDRCLECLDFWGCGNLFVFFEPKSKLACLLIQNT